MHGAIRAAVLAAAAMSMAGCATLGPAMQARRGNYFGNTPDLSADNVLLFEQRQNAILNSFIRLAYGVEPEQVGADIDWRRVTDAGLGYVDLRCDRFVDALFWFNRIRETTSRQLEYTGAAATAALSVVEAGRQLIGLTPLAFTLLDQTVNNVGQGLLYELDPTSVRILVEEQQTTFLGQLASTKFDRGDGRTLALQTIQNYASLCLPASIEAEVNRAVGNARFRPADYRLPQVTPEPAPVTAPADPATTKDNSTAANAPAPIRNNDATLPPRVEQSTRDDR